MGGDEPEIYCICRSSDVSRFMIGCDHCEEWYHGDCINVTVKEAKYIKKFFCKECRDKNSHLSVVYKSKYAELLKSEQSKSSKEEKTKSSKIRDDEEEDKQEKKKAKDKKKHKDRSRSREKHHKEKHREKHKDKKHKQKLKEEKRDKKEWKEERKEKERKEIKKEQHESKIKEEVQEEKKRRKVFSDSEEEEDNDVEIIEAENEEEEEKKRRKEEERKVAREREALRAQRRKEEEEKRRRETKEKEAATRKKERSFSTDSPNRSEDPPIDTQQPSQLLQAKARKVLQSKQAENLTKDTSEDEWTPVQPTGPREKTLKRKMSRDAEFAKRKRAWRPSTYDSSEDEEAFDMTPRQCYGMECINTARVGSKYCSDQCGLTVASLRIYQTLPERIREWKMTRCKAEDKNRKELDQIRKEIQLAKQRLQEADKAAEVLEATIARAKTLTIIEHKEDDSDSEDEEVRCGAVNCISCGRDVPSRTAIRHMETCFNKFESQTSFGSMYKTRIEGYQMFCDFYNPQTETYCKRLRVICPEHTKEPKILDTEVCGFPVTKNIFSTTGEFCRRAKKECNEHFCWEKLRRAELDMDRVRQWLKLDELLEKERQEKEAMSRRAGVLNLMLHSTFDHDLAMKLQQKQLQQAALLAKKQSRQHRAEKHGQRV